MSAMNKPAKYSAEQIEKIIGRILTLRTNRLRVVETRLASRQGRSGQTIERAARVNPPNLVTSIPGTCAKTSG